MSFKWFWLVILFSFITYTFINCVEARKKLSYEIHPHDHIKVVFTPEGQQIKFDSRGGFLVQLEKTGIAGRTVKGNWIFLQLKDVKEIHTTSPILTNWRSRLRDKKITEVVTKDNILVRFNPEGAVYIDSIRTIKGVNQNGYEEIYQLKAIKGGRFNLPEIISKDSLLKRKDQFIAEILTNDQKLIIFDKRGGIFVEPSNVIVGFTTKGSIVRLNRDQIDIGLAY